MEPPLHANKNHSTKKKTHISWSLLILDFIGTALIALGLAEITGLLHVIPQSIQFEHYAMVLIVFGLILMVPFAIDIVKQLRNH